MTIYGCVFVQIIMSTRARRRRTRVARVNKKKSKRRHLDDDDNNDDEDIIFGELCLCFCFLILLGNGGSMSSAIRTWVILCFGVSVAAAVRAQIETVCGKKSRWVRTI